MIELNAGTATEDCRTGTDLTNRGSSTRSGFLRKWVLPIVFELSKFSSDCY